jgi:hypothetical protein
LARRASPLEACHAREVVDLAFALRGTPDTIDTDQGSHFTASEFIGVVLTQGCHLSMANRHGAWRDNAHTESFLNFLMSKAPSQPGQRHYPARAVLR